MSLAQYDELTGCLNFRWTMELLEKELFRCFRYHKTLTLMLIDLDHFKNINDTHGHLIGNKVLQLFAGTLAKNLRTVDIVGRYSGEEFLVACRNQPRKKRP